MDDENKKNSEAYEGTGKLLYDAGRIEKEASNLYSKFSDGKHLTEESNHKGDANGAAASGKDIKSNPGVAASGSEGAANKIGDEGGKIAANAASSAEGAAEGAGEKVVSKLVGRKIKLIVLGVIILSLMCMVLTVGTTSQSQFQGVFHLTAKGDDAYMPLSDEEIYSSLYDQDAARKDTCDLIDVIIKVKAENHESTISKLKKQLKANNWDVERSMNCLTETSEVMTIASSAENSNTQTKLIDAAALPVSGIGFASRNTVPTQSIDVIGNEDTYIGGDGLYRYSSGVGDDYVVLLPSQLGSVGTRCNVSLSGGGSISVIKAGNCTGKLMRFIYEQDKANDSVLSQDTSFVIGSSEVMSFGIMGSKLLSSSTSLYSMTDIRTLSCFSISVGNGQLIKTGPNSYTSQTGLPVRVDIFDKEINYKSTLKSALNKYLQTGTFYEIDFEREDGGIKVYDDPEIIEKTEIVRNPETGEAIIDPETGEPKTETTKKTKHHYYVHPILMEKNLSQIAEDIFFLDVDSIYDNSVSATGSGLGEITVREAINKLSEGTQAILYGDMCGSDLFYFSNFSGEYEWPAPDNYRVTSPYGYRIHPISGKYKLHAGIDIAGVTGSPVVAAESGYVEFAGYNSSYGNYIKVKHSDAQTSLYAHLSTIGVITGETVSRGQQIGLIGSTGNSTGPHLHFEVRINGSSTDPLPFICSEENKNELSISN